MFCGISSFHHIAGDDPLAPARSRSKKKQISKSKSNSKSKTKNPYSSRGLDKFTSVLSELEARREKIMASTGAQGITMVRFMYSNSQDWIPIIVRLRDEGGNNNNNHHHHHNNNNKIVSTDASAVTSPKKPMVPAETTTSSPQPPPAVAAVVAAAKRLPQLKWRQGYCVPVMMVLILVCLVIFGRVFAICCASIWWYVVPTLDGEEGGRMRRRVSMKADYVKKMSSKRLPVAATPQAKIMSGGGFQELASPRGRSRKKCDL